MKKDLKSFEVAELDTIPKQNLDRNAHFNGNTYETVIFIVLGLCLAFIVLIIVSLAIYFYSRKKVVNSNDHNSPIQRPGNEPEPLDYEVTSVLKKKPGQTIALYHYCGLSRFF